MNSAQQRAALLARLSSGRQHQQPERGDDADGPLSYQQRAIWLAEQMHKLGPAYHIVVAWQLTGTVNVRALTLAIEDVCRYQPMLRTAFSMDDEQPRQQVTDAQPQLRIIDQRQADGPAHADLGDLLSSIAAETFDLSRAPLLRATLLRIREEQSILQLVLHHIASDGWSRGVLASNLSIAYNARLAGQAPDWQAPQFSYLDYCRWQQSPEQTQRRSPHLSYWKTALINAQPCRLPHDRPRPRDALGEALSVNLELPTPLMESLERIAARHSATLYVLLIATYQVLISRHTEQTDITVGSPSAQRTWAASEALVGCFANTLVMRNDLSGDPTFADVLQRTNTVVQEALTHADAPFDQVKASTDHARLNPGVPLLNASFVLQNLPDQLPALQGLTVSEHPQARLAAKFDLTLSIVPGERFYQARFEYASSMFDRTTIERLSAHYLNLLHAACADSTRPISRLALLSAEERHRLLVDWNDTRADYPRDKRLDQLFAEQVARTPEKTAVRNGHQAHSYADIERAVQRLSAHLSSQGVERGDKVLVCMNRSADLLIAMLAVMRSGAAYVPVDPDYPEARIRHIAEDTGARLALTSVSLCERIREICPGLHCIDPTEYPTSDIKLRATPVTTRSDDLAYVLYTSGSTGRPKGVCVSHQGLTNYLWWAKQAYDSDHGAGAPMHTSIAFDLSITSLYAPLLRGECVTFIASGSEEPARLATALANAQPPFSLAKITPSHLTLLQLSQESGVTQAAPAAFVIGGEALRAEQLAYWRERFPQTRLINEYGPTETVVGCTTYTVTADTPASGSLPIGRPIANTRIYVLDQSRQPVPIGTPGEIYIAGDGVALGYLNLPDETAKRFVTLDLGDGLRERAYRSGDMGRYRQDGCLEYLGRADNQIKLHGHRIEPGEIEAVLLEDTRISQCRVVVRGEGDARHLLAYAAMQPSSPAEDIIHRLSQRLPEYMLPADVVVMDALPMTINGKIDDNALPEPLAKPASNDRPLSPLATSLCTLFSELLGIENAHADTHFFQNGGNSLLAVRLMLRIKERLHIDATIRDILQQPTPATLAAHLAGRSATQTTALQAPADPVDVRLATPAQQRMWYLQQLAPASDAYHMSYAWVFSARLDHSALQRAFESLLTRHDALRTTYAHEDGELRTSLQPVSRFSLESLTLPSQTISTLTDRCTELSRRPFNLERDLPIRASILQCEEGQVLLIRLHHIAADGWSLEIMWRELATAYRAHADGQPPALPPQRLSHADYVGLLQGSSYQQQAQAQRRFWQEYLRGYQHVRLPVDHTAPPHTHHAAQRFQLELAAKTMEHIGVMAQRYDVTRNTVLLAALQLVVYRYTGHADVGIGVPVAGRNHPGTEDLVGLLINTVLIRSNLAGNPTVSEHVQHTAEDAFRAYDNQLLPFEEVVRFKTTTRDSGSNPLFEVALGQRNPREVALELNGEAGRPLRVHNETAKFDLLVSAAEDHRQPILDFDYRASRLDARTIRQLAKHLERTLVSMATMPDCPIDTLPMLSTEEWTWLTGVAGRSHRSPPAGEPLTARFRSVAARQPDALALVDGRDEITYEELDKRSDAVAARLIASGAQPGSFIGVHLPRSHNFVTAVIGVLKSGCAYLPMDHAAPTARTETILRDATVSIVLVEDEADVANRIHGVAYLSVGAAATTETPPALTTGSDAPAYIMYTSGTTGTPKGTLVSHRAVASLAVNPDYVDIGAEDRIAHISNVAFDAATFEIWGALLNGACLVVAQDEQILNPGLLERLLKDHHVSTVFLTTALFNIHAAARPSMFATVQQVLFGGEVADSAIVSRVLAASPPKRLINVYGPTECTTFSTAFELPLAWPEQRPVPIGRPIAGRQAYILDSNQQPVPVGVTGDLYIAGEGVALGYLNQPQLTIQRFLDCPFDTGSVMYRTGDRCRWNHDGVIEYTSRGDRQIKLSGYRIEPGDIEATLLQAPDVSKALVSLETVGDGHQVLTARISSTPGQQADGPTVQRFLEERLPSYMLPRRIVIESGRITANGKLELTKSAALDLPARTPAMRQTPTERTLALLWSELLGTQDIAVDDNFFALGGHSLLLVRLKARVDETFDADVPLAAMFSSPTVAGMAGLLTQPATVNDRGFISVLRQSTGIGRVVCIGAQVKELVESLPANIGIVQLSSGGIDPVRFHKRGIGHVATQYAKAVEALGDDEPTVLVGYSYSGLLAMEIKRRLSGNHSVHAMLLEPSLPGRQKKVPWRARIRQRLHRWRHGPATPEPMSDDDALWYRIETTLRRNIRAHRCVPMDAADVTIVGMGLWLDASASVFTTLFHTPPGSIDLGAGSHDDVVTDLRCVHLWTAAVRELLRKMRQAQP